MFSRKTADFLFENHLKDSKEWFNENRSDYEQYVLEPLRQLVCELSEVMHEIDPLLICEPKVGKSISRIYRDTRFFRDHMWLIFIRDKKLYNGLPGFYFEVSPNSFSYGCGYYSTAPASMAAVRKLILDGDADAKRALESYKKQDVFTLVDERYKRSKYPDAPPEQREWLDQRGLCAAASSKDAELLFSDKLAKKLGEDYKKLRDIYMFMMKAESLKDAI